MIDHNPRFLFRELFLRPAILECDTIEMVNNRHRETLRSIFENPVRSNIPWTDIEKMLVAFGARLSEGRGSRLRISLHGVRAIFHRPHPAKETDRGAIVSMRRFLTEAGISSDEV